MSGVQPNAIVRGITVYQTHPKISTPPPGTRLWRYMDVTKLISLLRMKSLYFPRADLLGDPWEGAVSHLTIKMMEQIPAQLCGRIPDLRKDLIRQTFVSCWHQNEYESAAMWKLYLKSDEGVAIGTTCDRLSRCFRDGTTYNVFIGAVQYLDYARNLISDRNVLLPLFIKRCSFSHENEVRAIINPFFQTPPQPDVSPELEQPSGLALKIDVDLLIEYVYVAPGTPDWVMDAVQSILDRFSLNRTVQRSSLSDSPVF